MRQRKIETVEESRRRAVARRRRTGVEEKIFGREEDKGVLAHVDEDESQRGSGGGRELFK